MNKFFLQKMTTVNDISEGIGIIETFKIKLPPSSSPILIEPKPTRISQNTILWTEFDWSKDLKLEYE
jgi:hypothetical protein